MQKMNKEIHGAESRVKMMEGIDQLADVVGSTLGAKGRNVVLDKGYGAPLVINDGVTIAREIFFDDTLKNVAAQLIKDAAVKTNTLAGDGTTSSIVLARAIVKAGWEAVKNGASPVALRKEIDAAAAQIEKRLKESARQIESKEQAIQIATVSVQDVELGEKIGSVMYEVGASGAVTVKDALKKGVFIEKDEGMRLDGQLVGGVVENPDKWETKMQNLKVLILQDSPEDHEFETKWIPVLKQFADGEQLPNGEMRVLKVACPTLLVVAEKLSRRFIMAMNSNKEIIKWVWFRPTTADKNMKEIYKDLQGMVGGKNVNEEDGVFLSQMTLEDFGSADAAVITRHDLVITVAKEQLGDRYLDRVNVVAGQIESAEDEIEKRQIEDRYARLTGGVAVIKASGSTDQETNELKLRIEDAINATRSAMEEGCVAGGGVALWNARQGGASEKKILTNGEVVLVDACGSLIKQILHNAGYDDVENVMSKLDINEGVDVEKDMVVDMFVQGVIDPLKVVRLVLAHAVSVAGLLLTSEYVITEEEGEMDAVRKFFKGK
jgi:chaperonin GroEL